MKKSVRIIAFLLAMVLCAAALSGCRMNHYDRTEIEKWAEEYFDEPVNISEDFTQRITEESYTDRVWTATLESHPELEFEIYSHKYYAMESIHHNIETTYHSVYGKYFYDKYISENESFFAPEKEQQANSSYHICAYFTDRAELEEIFSQAEKINAYMKENGVEKCLAYYVRLDDILSAVKDTEVWVRVDPDDPESAFSEINGKLCRYASRYRLALDQVTTDELETAVAEEGFPFVITRADGTQESYPDLTLVQSGYEMTFGTLYEILRREGFTVDGTADAFSFTGADGSEYEFSYSFNDYPYESEERTLNGYYYLKDGSRMPLQYYHYCHFRSALFTEMTGMSFEKITEE